ncbi:MAG TPA: efflux RND transporter periplasmic adaptor subunit [Terriglobales bacterium]|nr:efflux RND transporter periplasmic adaptor subunit [Terriglobales bacterium]
MTRKEITLTVAGVALGLALAAGYLAWRDQSKSATAAPMVAPAAAPPDHSAHRPGAAGAEAASVMLSDAEQKSIGVQLTAITRRDIASDLLLPGRVDEAETQLSTISARVAGRIDRLFLDFTGQPVRRGQAVASIYSPDLLTAAQEYRLALESQERLANATAEAREQANDLVAASRRKLELWGLSASQIDELAAGRSAVNVTTYSPASGVVKERKVTAGQYVSEGEALFTIADLSRVWVLADVYQDELSRLRTGAAAEITTDALPGTKLRGRVSFLDPNVSPETRTTAARIEVANPELRLRPGMFVRVRLDVGKRAPTLAVPRTAVLDTGADQLVYVARGNGEFEQRPVRLGEATDGYYPVLSGLKEGESVVTRGAFMIDSQTRITGGMSGMFGGAKEYSSQPSPPSQTRGATLRLMFDPAEPKGGQPVNIKAHLTDDAGKNVAGAEVAVTFFMPAMPSMGMGEMKAEAALAWDGSAYAGQLNVPMSGAWTVTAVARKDGALIAQQRTRVTAK